MKTVIAALLLALALIAAFCIVVVSILANNPFFD
jgi:hypothetical protein